MNECFIVELTDGTKLTFGKKCNRVEYDNDKYCIFKHVDSDQVSYETLAIIPHISIFSIIKCKERSNK